MSLRPHLERLGVDLRLKGDGVRGWAPLVREALDAGIGTEAAAEAIAKAPDWMRPREALGPLIDAAKSQATPDTPRSP